MKVLPRVKLSKIKKKKKIVKKETEEKNKRKYKLWNTVKEESKELESFQTV